MDISIAMCTYNGEKFLAEQLTSLQEQTKLPFELVVCDDCSTDSTSQLLRQFAASAPFPVRIFSNQLTMGSTRNFDQAIGLCRGQAIALCDQDDLWEPNKLHWIGQLLLSDHKIGGVFSNASLIDEKSQMLSESLWERRKYNPRLQAAFQRNPSAQLLRFNPATGSTFVFRADLVSQVTPIPVEWVHDAWIALLVATQTRVHLLPEKLIRYRIHAAQQIGVKRSAPSDDLLVTRWTSMQARLATLPVDPAIGRQVHKRLHFLKARRELKQQRLAPRLVAASRTLPGYFRFARGLFSYMRDVAAQESRVES